MKTNELTPMEAFRIIEDGLRYIVFYDGSDGNNLPIAMGLLDSCKNVIEVIKQDIEEYVKLKELDTPKKVIEGWRKMCPKCRQEFIGSKPKHCPECGQALLWEEENE